MKTFFLTLSFFLPVLLGASISPADLIIQADPTSHTLTLRSLVAFDADTELMIVDDQERTLHRRQIAAGNYLNVRFKLAALPVGDYRVSVEDRNGRTLQPLTVTTEGIQVDPKLASEHFYPRVDLVDDLLTINYLNISNSRVAIRLADDRGNELISDRVPSGPTLQRAYSLEALPAGTYTLTVNSRKEPAYTQTVVLD